MSIGARLRILLDRNGISQSYLAKKLAIAPSTLNGYIKDHREPDAKMLSLLAKELNTTVDYLVNGTAPAPENDPYLSKVKVIAHNEGVALTKEQEEAVARYMKFLLSEDPKQ